MAKPTKQSVRRRQLGILGTRYVLFAAGTACSLVLAASFLNERLTIAIGEWLCETSSSCSEPLTARSTPEPARPLVLPVSAPGEPRRLPTQPQEAP